MKKFGQCDKNTEILTADTIIKTIGEKYFPNAATFESGGVCFIYTFKFAGLKNVDTNELDQTTNTIMNVDRLKIGQPASSTTLGTNAHLAIYSIDNGPNNDYMESILHTPTTSAAITNDNEASYVLTPEAAGFQLLGISKGLITETDAANKSWYVWEFTSPITLEYGKYYAINLISDDDSSKTIEKEQTDVNSYAMRAGMVHADVLDSTVQSVGFWYFLKNSSDNSYQIPRNATTKIRLTNTTKFQNIASTSTWNWAPGIKFEGTYGYTLTSALNKVLETL